MKIYADKVLSKDIIMAFVKTEKQCKYLSIAAGNRAY